jgi:hypothetical protein
LRLKHREFATASSNIKMVAPLRIVLGRCARAPFRDRGLHRIFGRNPRPDGQMQLGSPGVF